MEIEVGSIAAHFSVIEDPRRDAGKRHPLMSIITMALCAVVGGADTWPEVEEFAESKAAWFGEFLELPHGIPSHYTFRRVFQLLDAEQLQRSFSEWTAGVEQVTAGSVVAIDGKALRRAYTKSGKRSAIHMVSAWSEANGLVLGQVKVADKSNEVTAIPRLLELLRLKGCIVTIDAMGCQREIAQQISDQQADYLLALKQNQGTLYADVDHLFRYSMPENFDQPLLDYASQVNKGHGRVEKRECRVVADPDWLALLRRQHDWPALRTIVKVVGRRSTDDKRAKPDVRYYITSLEPDAAAILAATRAHWGGENQLHWVLDVTFREDESRLRLGNGQENMATLRRWALNLLRQDSSSKASLKRKRRKAGWDNNYLARIMFGA